MSLGVPDSLTGKQHPRVDKPTLTFEELLERDPTAGLEAKLVPFFAKEIIQRLTDKGFVEHKEPGYVYNMPLGEVYVRRGSPERMTKALLGEEGIHLSFDGLFGSGDKYLNAAVYNSRYPDKDTISWSILEGWSKSGGIYMVIGFDKNSPTINEHKLDIPRAELFRSLPGGQVMDRTLFRSLSGEIRPVDIRFILLGIPAQRFPEDLLTTQEKMNRDEWTEEMKEWEAGDKKDQRPDPIYVTRTFVPPLDSKATRSVQFN